MIFGDVELAAVAAEQPAIASAAAAVVVAGDERLATVVVGQLACLASSAVQRAAYRVRATRSWPPPPPVAWPPTCRLS